MQDYEKIRAEEHARAVDVEARVLKALGILKEKQEKQDQDRLKDYYDFTLWTERLRVHFSASFGDKRLHVSGVYPRTKKGEWVTVYFSHEETEAHRKEGKPYQDGLKEYEYGRIQEPEITISADATPEVIARNITKRFMPSYNAYLARVKDVITKNNDYNDTTEKTLKYIKGEELTTHEIATKSVSVDFEKLPGQEYSARAHVKASRQDITLELHNMTPEVTTKIFSLIRKETAK